jgi:hypothetical protein
MFTWRLYKKNLFSAICLSKLITQNRKRKVVRLEETPQEHWQVEFAAVCGYSFASLPMFIHYLLAFR